MAASGFQTSMARSLKNNANLLNRNNLFAQLNSINLKSDQKQTYIPMQKEALAILRKEERNQMANNLFNRRIIGILVIIPTAFVLMAGFYLLIHALM